LAVVVDNDDDETKICKVKKDQILISELLFCSHLLLLFCIVLDFNCMKTKIEKSEKATTTNEQRAEKKVKWHTFCFVLLICK